MVRHPLVERIGFVGSVETGRIIAREAADGLKKVTLELGGKNPIIIFPDADPAKAARAAVEGALMGEWLIMTHAVAREGAEARWEEIDDAFRRQAPPGSDDSNYKVQELKKQISAGG